MSETPPSFGVPHSDTAMQHDDAHDDDFFGSATFTADNDELPPSTDGDEPDADDDDASIFEGMFGTGEFEPEREHLKLVGGKPRGVKAKQYERKVQGVFGLAVRLTIGNEKTVADSAALIMHGPNIAEKAGDLAAVNPKAAAIIDSITDQTENPATALIMATVPLALQIVRNHEPKADVQVKGIPIGRGRRLRLRFPFKLGKRMKNMTHEPNELTVKVLTNPQVQQALAKQNIIINVGE